MEQRTFIKRKKSSVGLLLRGLFFGTIHILFIAVCLFIPTMIFNKGKWDWDKGTYFLLISFILVQTFVTLLFFLAPQSLKVRLKKPISKNQPKEDKIASLVLMISFIVWFSLIPIDLFYLKVFNAPPEILCFIGGFMALFGFILIYCTIYQNPFAAPIVEDQREEGQYLVDTGVYGFVRHPMYSGLILSMVGIALYLESYFSLITLILVILGLVFRINVEEKTLKKTLSGYEEYAKLKVRFKVIPGIW